MTSTVPAGKCPVVTQLSMAYRLYHSARRYSRSLSAPSDQNGALISYGNKSCYMVNADVTRVHTSRKPTAGLGTRSAPLHLSPPVCMIRPLLYVRVDRAHHLDPGRTRMVAGRRTHEVQLIWCIPPMPSDCSAQILPGRDNRRRHIGHYRPGILVPSIDKCPPVIETLPLA